MRLIKFLLGVGLLSYLLLMAIFFFYKKGYVSYHSVKQQSLDEIIEGCHNYDLLFLGSSRTYVHVNPKIIDSVTGLNSYNAGVDGANLLEINLALQCYLEKHICPKLVVVDLSMNAFDIERRPIFNPLRYYPFLKDTVVYSMLAPYKKTFLLRYLPFTQLTEADDYTKTDALYGWLDKKENLNGNYYKGYEANGYDTLTIPFRSGLDTNFYQVTVKGKVLFNELMQTCQSRNIKLVITYAPEFYLIKRKNNPVFFKTITEVTSKNNIPFIDYSKSIICRDNKLFANPGHLNTGGAGVYSNLLAKDLKKMTDTF